MSTDDSAGASPLESATLTKLGVKSNKKDKVIKRENTIKKLEDELNELKTYSPKYRINTRSQNISEHAQLIFETKSKKMAEPQVILKLEEAIKLIPHCSGEEDIYQFINACDLAVNSIDKANVPILIRYITTRLSGKPLEIIKYKDLSKWVYIKKYLEEAFESQYSASALQLQLNSVKMNQGESINSYTERVEKLFYKLCNIYTLNKSEGEAKIIQNQKGTKYKKKKKNGLSKKLEEKKKKKKTVYTYNVYCGETRFFSSHPCKNNRQLLFRNGSSSGNVIFVHRYCG